jgi:hypothetical protein
VPFPSIEQLEEQWSSLFACKLIVPAQTTTLFYFFSQKNGKEKGGAKPNPFKTAM